MPKALISHPVANLFPEMNAADFAALVEDIRKHGVKMPILLYRGQILDGRHRYRACQNLGRSCPVVRWNGHDPWFEAQSRNLVRRHLAKDQLYAIRKLAAERFPELAAPIEAAKMEARQRKVQAKGQALGKKALSRSQDRQRESADMIGAQIGVSGTTVKRVDRLAREAPELVARVAAGELSVKMALREVAIGRHGPLVIQNAAGMPFCADRSLRRLQQYVRSEWIKWPCESRVRFLDGLEHVLRELIRDREQHKTETDQVMISAPNCETIWDGSRNGPNRGLLGVIAYPIREKLAVEHHAPGR
jgi:hypothetical protein